MSTSTVNLPARDVKRTAIPVSPQESLLGSTLSNKLHPLFRQHNFRASALTHETSGTSDEEPILAATTYDRLLPALRLASNLLEFSLPFLAKISFAPLVFPNIPGAPPSTTYALDPRFVATDAHIHRLRAQLAAWATRTRFYCNTPGPVADGCGGGGGGCDKACTEVRTGGKSAGDHLPAPAYTVTSISQETMAFFARQDYDQLPVDVRTAQLVELAFVLVHEQAHAVFHCRWAEDEEMSAAHRAFIARVTPVEPLYHTQVGPKYDELGFAWSAWVHGGSVLSLGTGQGGLILIGYPDDVFQVPGTTAQNYPFREVLLSEAFWTYVQNAGRPPVGWNVESAHLGWLGQVMTAYNSV
ncbi:hypothetical protein N0V93_007895 [Gnomoniopsis smithogilvyi]|uniref:Uncharacterized protein n=1 Tax=Gnomoniopsis smithogilvyi TaxID=1191159 RepID=A0A9W8YM70_9PEZI|nr:hypothetical protein N0V93_007895 [Gnomoniopsis smithogilvyi]